ncbi:hypothetical protein Tco_1227132 [Tanacetum coccineum]
MRQTKNLMDINIDALYNILKQNQGDVNDASSIKKKAVVVTLDPLALVAEKTKVSMQRKVVVHSESEESDDEDISDLKKITALLAKSVNRKKYYAKPMNNNLRTSSASSLANKKLKYVKQEENKEDKKEDGKKLVPSCCVIFDLEPLSLSFDFVFTSEIFKSLSFCLNHLFRLAILCLDQHAHTLHHLETLLIISFDRLDIVTFRI